MQRADGELAAGDYRDASVSRAVPLATCTALAGVMALGLGPAAVAARAERLRHGVLQRGVNSSD